MLLLLPLVLLLLRLLLVRVLLLLLVLLLSLLLLVLQSILFVLLFGAGAAFVAVGVNTVADDISATAAVDTAAITGGFRVQILLKTSMHNY